MRDAIDTSGDEALRAHVRRAFGTLRPEHREVILLAHFQRLTLRQIAERTATPIETVQKRATEALKSLKDALDGAGTAS